MEMKRYRICDDIQCDSFTSVSKDIEKNSSLNNVRIDPYTRELFFDNPTNCHVDEKMLEEAARNPDVNIQFQRCD